MRSFSHLSYAIQGRITRKFVEGRHFFSTPFPFLFLLPRPSPPSGLKCSLGVWRAQRCRSSAAAVLVMRNTAANAFLVDLERTHRRSQGVQ